MKRYGDWRRTSESTMTNKRTGARVIRFCERYYLEGAAGSHDPVSGGRKAMGVFETFDAAARAAEATQSREKK